MSPRAGPPYAPRMGDWKATTRDLVGCTLAFLALPLLVMGLQAGSLPAIAVAAAMFFGGYRISTLS